ncbi:membrane protein [Photobacterium gaetbulicola]|uniref:Membrane protein n=1 Tax=Photobacterium gaetbulicola TaxID=1295392 RepID=A0A0B9GEG1_9GAMM|nr:regulatory protein ToxS [Photobacterium gaetbulicola]KHT63160.1 membrane protein [Photobacterium gaetbulicola]
MSVDTPKKSVRHFIYQYWAFILVGLSALFSAWLYYSSDYKLEQLLISREWQSRTVSRIEETELEQLGMLRRVEQTSHVVYLPNSTYSRITLMRLFSDNEQPLTIHISESGNWDVSGKYLLTEPTEFKDITSGTNEDFQPEHLTIINKLYRMDAQQSRRMDIINEKTILLTSLSYGSHILYSL